MDTQYAIFVAVAAGGFAVALLAVMTQWLKADDAALDAELGVRDSMRRIKNPGASEPPAPIAESLPAVYVLADDETALSRLLLGWSMAGTFVGLAIGGATFGLVGALVGGVVLATVAVIGVVVGVLVVDKVRANAAERRRLRQYERHDIAPPHAGAEAHA